MKNNTKIMTEGTPWKLISAFALPILLSFIFQQLYNTVDSLIVGRFLGTESLAAVSSSGPLIFLVTSFITGTAMGAGIVISKYFGAGDSENVSKAVHTDIAFGLSGGAVITVIGLILTPVLLRIMNTDSDVMPEAIQYFTFYFGGSLFVIMYNICTGIMNAVGNSRRPLLYLIISSILNVVLDILFVAVLKWGVWSAAFATSISQAVAALLSFEFICRKGTVYQFVPKKLRFHGRIFREIIRYGLPSGVQNSVIGLANVLVQTNINSFGKMATAAYGSYAKLEGFAFLPINSFTSAISTFISQNLGAKKYDRAKQGSVFGIAAGTLLTEIVGVILYVFAPVFIGLFSDDPEVIRLGVVQARTESLFFFLLAFSHSVAAVCRGSGHAAVAMSVMLSVWCVLRITYITVIMNFVHEIQMIYWAYPLTWGISAVIYALYYKFSDWCHGFEKKPATVQR